MLPPALFDPKVAADMVALCRRVDEQARRDPGPAPDRVGRMRTAAV
jgi:hypothetical protein